MTEESPLDNNVEAFEVIVAQPGDYDMSYAIARATHYLHAHVIDMDDRPTDLFDVNTYSGSDQDSGIGLCIAMEIPESERDEVQDDLMALSKVETVTNIFYER